jgi:hypothetical protein
VDEQAEVIAATDEGGCWKLLASIILQAIDDGLKGNAGAHAWLMQPDPWLEEICDLLNIEVDTIQRRYWELKTSGKRVSPISLKNIEADSELRRRRRNAELDPVAVE